MSKKQRIARKKQRRQTGVQRPVHSSTRQTVHIDVPEWHFDSQEEYDQWLHDINDNCPDDFFEEAMQNNS